MECCFLIRSTLSYKGQDKKMFHVGQSALGHILDSWIDSVNSRLDSKLDYSRLKCKLFVRNLIYLELMAAKCLRDYIEFGGHMVAHHVEKRKPG